MDNEEKFLFNKERSFSMDRCFVCDTVLNDENRTEEHIYPKWLQRKFNLYNQKISLLNGTFINYRNLKVPCCKECNVKMSARIEKLMEQAVESGYENFAGINRNIVFQWLNKLSYGMLYKEAMLLRERGNREGGYIVPREIVNELHMKYVFLISIIKDTEYVLSPYSLLIFKIKKNEKNEKNPYWGYYAFLNPVFCMYMNDIGIVAHLQDNKFNEDFFKEQDKMNDLLQRELHVMQFREVCARFLYKSSLFIRNPAYIMIMDEEAPKQIISQEMSGIGYSDWKQEEYAKVLEFFWSDFEVSYQDIYKGNDMVWTLLWDESGNFIELKDETKEIK